MSTAASSSRVSAGTTSTSARGPPVDAAIATAARAPRAEIRARAVAGATRPSAGTPRRLTTAAARNASRSRLAIAGIASAKVPAGLRTKSTAPSSSARSVRSTAPRDSTPLSITTARGASLMM